MIRDLLKRGEIAIAHRGDPMRWPQNTRSSFISALGYDIDMIETDINMTKDGRLVIIHDQIVDFTSNGKGEVYDFTLAEIRKLDFGSWMGKQFAVETILTLEEFIELAAPRKIGLNIEIKNAPRKYPHIEETLLKILKKTNFQESVIVSSFDHAAIKRIKEIDRGIVCAILYSAGLIDNVTPARLALADGIHPEHSLLTIEAAKAAKQAGLFINVWTLDNPDRMRTMLDMGVSGIISNYPDRLVQTLKKTQ